MARRGFRRDRLEGGALRTRTSERSRVAETEPAVETTMGTVLTTDGHGFNSSIRVNSPLVAKIFDCTVSERRKCF